MKIKYRINGQEVTKEEFEDAPSSGVEYGEMTGALELTAGTQGTTQPSSRRSPGWPFFSIGAEVHPEQREEAMAEARGRGCPTYYNKQGQPEMQSLKHQKKFNDTIGFFNQDGNS